MAKISPESRRLLVVSDQPDRLVAITETMTQDGLEVVTRQGSLAALSYLKDDPTVSAIITDLRLRVIDGPQFCRLLRSREYPSLNEVPIIICSHRVAGAQMGQVFNNLGAAVFLEGPFDPRLLKSHVQDVLAGHVPRQSGGVLIVQPQEELATEIAAGFKERGYTARIALCGNKGRQFFREYVPTIVVINYELPDISCLALLREFKRVVPKTTVVITADHIAPGVSIELVQAGAEACMPIPLTSNSLFELCETVQREREFLRVVDLLRVQSEREQWMEDQLSKQRAELEMILDAVPAFITYKNRSHRFVRVNKAFSEALGKSYDDVVGKTMADLFEERDTVDLSRYADDDDEVMSTGVAKTEIIEPYPAIDGGRWQRTDKVPHLDSSGETIGVISLSVDITENKRAQEQLEWATNVNAALADISRQLFSLSSFEEISSAVCAHAKRLTESRLGDVCYIDPKTQQAFYADDTGEIKRCCDEAGTAALPLLAQWNAALDSRQPLMENNIPALINQPAADEATPLTTEGERLPGTGAEGEQGLPITRFCAVPCMAGDKLVGQIALANAARVYDERDLSFVKRLATIFSLAVDRIDAELERSRLAMAVEQVADSIVIMDVNGAIEYVNPAFEKVSGRTREEVIGRDFRSTGGVAPEEVLANALNDQSGSNTVWTGHVVGSRKDGTKIEEEATVSPLRDPGEQIIGYVAVKRDVTQEVKLQEQLRQSQKMEAIGQLAGGVAHDFNNLLSGILGHANLLMMDLVPGSPSCEAVVTIENAAKRAADLTSQLLGFAREGKMREAPCDINRIIHDIIGLLSRTIDKNIYQSHSLRPDLPLIMGDPSQLQQVFVNLAVNARDAMPGGGVLQFETDLVLLDEGFCASHPGLATGEFVMVTVADTGGGISEEMIGRIFEPFFTTKEPGKGTGLGLAMVYGIVRNHGGLIEVFSEPDKGATFAVYLPVCSKAHTTPPRMDHEKPLKGTGRILLVDDEELVRNIASRMLIRLGYEVVLAEDGKVALDRYRELAPSIDLVIIDLNMPVMGGRQCFNELKRITPRVKAVLSTGFGLDSKVQEALDDGIVGFVPKPYNLWELSVVVKNALIKKRN